jgi:hypothetical protein
MLGHFTKQLLDFIKEAAMVGVTTMDSHVHIVHADPHKGASNLQISTKEAFPGDAPGESQSEATEGQGPLLCDGAKDVLVYRFRPSSAEHMEMPQTPNLHCIQQ